MLNTWGPIYQTPRRSNLKDTGHPTGDDMGIDVEGVVDGVDGAPPVVPLAEGERAVIHADARHVRVPSQRDLR